MGGKTGCDRFKGKNDEIVGEIERIGYKNRHFLMGLIDLKEEGIWRLESTSEKTNYTNWHNSEPTTMAARIVLVLGLDMKLTGKTPGLIMEARWTKLATLTLGGGREYEYDDLALEENMKMSSSNPFL